MRNRIVTGIVALLAVATLAKVWLPSLGPSPAVAQVSCPTSLPPATNFTGGTTTQGQEKTAITSLVNYLTCLFGTDGTAATAKTTLGLAAIATSGSYADLSGTPTQIPIGACIPYGGSSAPTNYLFANSQAVSRSTYATLFSLYSTTFGSGDGSSTFNVPDLRGRIPAGVDNMGGIGVASRLGSGVTGGITVSATLGAAGGEQSHTLSTGELAQHNHGSSGLSVSVSGLTVTPQWISYDQSGPTFPGFNTIVTDAGSGALFAGTVIAGSNTPHTVTSPGFTTVISGSPSLSGNTANAGSGNAHNNTPPTLVMNYICRAL